MDGSRQGVVVTQVLAGAGVLGGLAHAAKGVVLLVSGRDLGLVPTMLVLFGLGMLALYRLVGPPARLARAGLAFTVLAISGGGAAVVCQVLGWQPEDPRDPVVADVTYGVGTFAVLAGLLLLGLAWHRDRRQPRLWRSVPLLAAVTWFPLEGLTAVMADGWGLLLAGLTWIAAAAVALGVAARPGAHEAALDPADATAHGRRRLPTSGRSAH